VSFSPSSHPNVLSRCRADVSLIRGPNIATYVRDNVSLFPFLFRDRSRCCVDVSLMSLSLSAPVMGPVRVRQESEWAVARATRASTVCRYSFSWRRIDAAFLHVQL
jgi:hypothetical protein